MSRSDKCQLKSGTFPDMQIMFSDTPGFQNKIVIKLGTTQPSGAEKVLTYSFSFLMVAKNGELTVRESVAGTNYQTYCRIARDGFSIVQCDDLNAEGVPCDTFTIILRLKTLPKIIYETNLKKKDPNLAGILCSNTTMAANRQLIESNSQYLKITAPGFRGVTHTQRFNEEHIRRILNQELLTDQAVVPKSFVRLQKLAIYSEDDMAEASKALLVRSGINAKFGPLPGYQYRWYAELHQKSTDPPWLLQGQERLIIAYHSPDESKATPELAGLLSQVPGPTPGKRDVTWWRGVIFFKNGLPCLAISNVIRADVADVIRKKPEVANVKVFFDSDEDVNTERALKALGELEEVMDNQIEPIEMQSGIRLSYHIPPIGIFLNKRRDKIRTDIPIIELKGTANQLLNDPGYQFSRQSHKDAVINACTSKVGISLIEGPPATGKTETITKLLAFVIKHGKIDGQHVALAAHTNVAVAVAASRFVKIAGRFGLNKHDACLIWTENKAAYGRLSSQDLPPELADITNDAHMLRIAQSDTARYANFLKGHDQIKRRGRIESAAILNKYLDDVLILGDLVKHKVRVFFATLATFHSKTWVLGSQHGWKGVDCAMLIIDEASQAHAVAAWLPWNILNPRRIVFAGDHRQLAPHTTTTEARWAWSESLFEALRNDDTSGVAKVMLDEQYRTVNNIYSGTNVLYGGRVQAHSSTQNRPLQTTLMNAVKRIGFIDFDKKRYVLSKNTHWFNLLNGKMVVSGTTSSSSNPLEQQFIISLFNALQKAGVPSNQCLLLTGYQAQYDELLQHELRLPGNGTVVKKVDSAQGDEAGIVGVSLVRTADRGLGFMATERRQNVLMSRARDGLYAVGSTAALRVAKSQGNETWMNWYDQMMRTNGQDWQITFNGPVEFFVDQVHAPTTTLRQPPPDDSPEPSTTKGMEKAFDDREAGIGGNTGSPTGSRRDSGASQGPRSPALRPSTPVQSPRAASPAQSVGHPGSPQGSPGPASPRMTAPFERPPTSHGGSGRQSSGTQPRRSSILNPEHGRSASISQQSLPIRPAGAPVFWANASVTDNINKIDQVSAQSLLNVIPTNMNQYTASFTAANISYFQERVQELYKARLNGDVPAFQTTIDKISTDGAPESVAANAASLSYAMERLWKLEKKIVAWPAKK